MAGTIDHFAGTHDPQDNPRSLIEISRFWTAARGADGACSLPLRSERRRIYLLGVHKAVEMAPAGIALSNCHRPSKGDTKATTRPTFGSPASLSTTRSRESLARKNGFKDVSDGPSVSKVNSKYQKIIVGRNTNSN